MEHTSYRRRVIAMSVFIAMIRTSQIFDDGEDVFVITLSERIKRHRYKTKNPKCRWNLINSSPSCAQVGVSLLVSEVHSKEAGHLTNIQSDSLIHHVG